MPSDSKRIVKNTVFLYIQMFVTMIISLYTSRVILEILGVNDYGIYHTVGGIVSMFALLNGVLANGSSRFLTFELGTGNSEKLKKTFSTVLSAHIIIALFLIFVGETAGLWFVNNKLQIPPDRMSAALFTYHLSLITFLFTLTQVPYSASIISHERMNIYAYTSIINASLKLLIVYMLTLGDFDRLKFYALLIFIVEVGMVLFYRIYCIRHFQETHYHFVMDKKILKDVVGFSVWGLFANTAIALAQHGTTVMINMFFSPAVVTSRALANTINMTAVQFIGNIRTAANPQIIKMYAAKDYSGSKHLLLESMKFLYFLMLLLALPIILVAEPLLQLWLGQVPPYSVIFLQLTIITSLFQVFDTSLYTGLVAAGRLKENALISPTVIFLAFPIIYILFKLGYGPASLAWVLLFSYMVLGLIIKPLIVIRIINYSWKDIFTTYYSCTKVTLLAIPVPCITYIYRHTLFKGTLTSFVGLSLVSILCVFIAVWTIGLDTFTRTKLVSLVKSKIKLITNTNNS